MGLAALYLSLKKKKPKKVWEGDCREIMERARQPRGQAELTIVPGIEQLIKNICAKK